MTPALLFALVDAVLRSVAQEQRGLARWCEEVGLDSSAEMTWGDAVACAQQVGWWRSLWPLGGGL